MNQKFAAVIEDLEWLLEEWWHNSPDDLSAGALRRGSAALHLLLVQGLLGQAWRANGFVKEPKIIAPDVLAIAAFRNLDPNLAASCIAGGGRQRGLTFSFLGAFRVDNPTTGVSAHADEGFAVRVESVLSNSPTSDLSFLPPVDGLCRTEYPLSRYLLSPSAIRMERMFSRQQVLEYFRNYAGGAHYEFAHPSPNRVQSTDYSLLAELDARVKADIRGGLLFELLSIGQAVATSPDVLQLLDIMRRDVS